jgi:dihydroneopterin aldolase
MDRILVAGLREMGVHGVLAEEQQRPQPFQVDLELLVDLGPAGATDTLEDTVDYGAIADAVRRVVADEHHQLLERLAARIADVCRETAGVSGVVVEVRKLQPPIAGQIDYVGVRIERWTCRRGRISRSAPISATGSRCSSSASTR